MNLETFKEKFEVTISNIKYIPNGHKSNESNVVKDSIDFNFSVKHKLNNEVKQFSRAYVVEDVDLDMTEYAKNAFSLLQNQIFEWSSLVENKISLEGSILNL